MSAAFPPWQPIADAPEDREIIVANHEDARTAQRMTCLEDGSRAWVVSRADGMAVLFNNPTHWMDKPTLPPREGITADG